MRFRRKTASARQAAVAPLVGLLLIPILGMVAFGVDTGYMVLAKSDLQSAADAAALAGAQQLMGQETLNANGKYTLQNSYTDYYLTGQLQQATILSTATAAATKSAKDFASYHQAGGHGSLTLNDSDITFGFTDINGNYDSKPSYTGFPNTCRVVMRLDSNANGPLQLFFGRVLGMDQINMTAKASATIYAGSVNSANTGTGQNMRLLPVTYDVNHWNNFLTTGLSPDGTISLDGNGVPQLQVYPSIKFTGNFGLLSMDQGNDGASTIDSWIDNGVPTSDLQQELNAKLLPLSIHDSTKWDWGGQSGLKTDNIHTLSLHVGDTYLLPLFKAYDSGVPDPNTYQAGVANGNNYQYNIVQFVGVRITYVDNYSVMVQPAAVTDPDAVFTNLRPAAPPPALSSALPTTFSYARLTR
jgi:Flp pilus assembly protein TadG